MCCSVLIFRVSGLRVLVFKALRLVGGVVSMTASS